MEIPFEDQLLVFEARLVKQGLASALELLNDRTKFRYTALHRFRVGNLLPVCVFDRFNENRAYLQSAQFLAALGAITVEAGDFVTSDCTQDARLKPLVPAGRGTAARALRRLGTSTRAPGQAPSHGQAAAVTSPINSSLRVSS